MLSFNPLWLRIGLEVHCYAFLSFHSPITISGISGFTTCIINGQNDSLNSFWNSNIMKCNDWQKLYVFNCIRQYMITSIAAKNEL